MAITFSSHVSGTANDALSQPEATMQANKLISIYYIERPGTGHFISLIYEAKLDG